MAAIDIMRLTHILILQNKIDLCRESQLKEQYDKILEFTRGADAPVKRQGSKLSERRRFPEIQLDRTKEVQCEA